MTTETEQVRTVALMGPAGAADLYWARRLRSGWLLSVPVRG